MSIIAQINSRITGGIQYVYIDLVDSVTGLPVNGNNITIPYTQTIGGTTSFKDVTIPGSSVLIYQTNVPSSTNSWQIISISPEPDPAPPVNQCDLAISFITVDKPESAPGANDAQITVNASSSYLPIQYTVDGIHYQTSNVFTGLSGGLFTVQVTDANTLGCTASQTVTISITQNLLLTDPTVTAGANTSRWSAAFNPVVFTYQRQDFEVTHTGRDSLTGNANIFINCDLTPIANAIATNQAIIANAAAQGITLLNNQNIYIYLNAGPYVGVFTILSVDFGGAVINTPYISDAAGFVNINMLRPYYKMLTVITYVDPLTGAINTITSVNRPNAAGVTTADISNFLQSLLRAVDGSDYTQVNFRDTNLSASYTIQYAEQYDDYQNPGNTLTSPYIGISAPYYVLYTARQIQSENAGNLAEYVPFPSPLTPAKWITDFTEPVYTNGYPFDMSFIYGEALAGFQLYYQIVLLDINRQPLSTGAITSYLDNEDGSWLLNQDSSRLIIASQNLVNTPIVQQVGLNRILINNTFGDDAYYFTIAVYYNDSNNNPVQLTQLQTVRIDHTPDINSVYMRWIGLSGSWNYYRFIYNQEISLDVQNATIIKNFVTDWQNQDGIEEVISKDAGQKMKLMAEDLSVADIKGLQSIKYSPKVQMMLSAGPVQWQTVVLNTATFSEYETFNGVAPFSITFNMPSINIQTQ